jgi:hypothetical protein
MKLADVGGLRKEIAEGQQLGPVWLRVAPWSKAGKCVTRAQSSSSGEEGKDSRDL